MVLPGPSVYVKIFRPTSANRQVLRTDKSAQEAVIVSRQSRQSIRNCFGAKICAHVAGLLATYRTRMWFCTK